MIYFPKDLYPVEPSRLYVTAIFESKHFTREKIEKLAVAGATRGAMIQHYFPYIKAKVP